MKKHELRIKITAVAEKINLVNKNAFSRFLSSAGPVGTKFYSDFSVTKNANSNLIAVLN